MRRVPILTLLIASVALALPAAAQESKFGADLRGEKERLAKKCGEFSGKALFGCATTLITDHPFHLAIGSLAPQNGFGFGLAFVAPQSKPNNDWRIGWSADAVGTPSGAWRAGVYAKFVNSRVPGVGVTGPGGGTDAGDALPRPYPTITAYAQIASLPKLGYYGLGNATAVADQSFFEMRQSTIGTRVFWPFGRSGFLNHLSPTVLGELNGRWMRVGGSSTAPSIEKLFTDATAPGLSTQPATLQLGEGLRIAPAIKRLQLAYTGMLQQYIATSDSSLSFRRWTLDLRHDFALYSTSQEGGVRENNSPNECSTSATRTAGEYGCPDPGRITKNRTGTIGFRALVSQSGVSSGSAVPFYFQRTIGGSDIDGERLLASYDDYRFRGPNMFVLQETFEHSIWGPIGAFATAEHGRVSLIDQSGPAGDIRNTFGAGLTLRAGGVPMATVWWATGGSEGQHLAMTMSASLFGGSSRPSLK